jgi:hypothetical protein
MSSGIVSVIWALSSETLLLVKRIVQWDLMMLRARLARLNDFWDSEGVCAQRLGLRYRVLTASSYRHYEPPWNCVPSSDAFIIRWIYPTYTTEQTLNFKYRFELANHKTCEPPAETWHSFLSDDSLQPTWIRLQHGGETVFHFIKPSVYWMYR